MQAPWTWKGLYKYKKHNYVLIYDFRLPDKTICPVAPTWTDGGVYTKQCSACKYLVHVDYTIRPLRFILRICVLAFSFQENLMRGGRLRFFNLWIFEILMQKEDFNIFLSTVNC